MNMIEQKLVATHYKEECTSSRSSARVSLHRFSMDLNEIGHIYK